MLDEREKHLISILPETEYGQALFKWLRDEISLLEDKEEFAMKICDNPIHEDFRVQLGIKIGMNRVFRKPKECFNELNKGEKRR